MGRRAEGGSGAEGGMVSSSLWQRIYGQVLDG